MKKLSVDDIRDLFLDFFVEKGHYKLPSFPLVPDGDKSLLLINSGMAPFKAYFTGQETPPSKRVATCQKCIRTTDIDDVGKDARHGSFFEMLGNFSFGDYFKKEAIEWAWEFLIKKLEIPSDKLFVSVYEEDDEAFAIWKNSVGFPESRIYKFGKDENFWEHGLGPCGPCSEIFFDRGVDKSCQNPNCDVGCDCDRFMEIWNLVFTQFEKLEDGSYVPLDNKNIDTGSGLERLAIVMQDVDSIFEIDNIKTIREKVLGLAGTEWENLAEEKRTSVNIICDHIRSVVFMASDGVLPSNEGRGYVLRRLLRRAVRHGKSLGVEKFAAVFAKASIDAYSHAYPSLLEKSEHIVQVLELEESRFLETLENGMSLLQRNIDIAKSKGLTKLPASDGFKLYDTFGFPPELTKEILEEAGLGWDKDGFLAEMENQKERARKARGKSTFMGADETVFHKLPPGLETEFLGYESSECGAKVLAMVVDDEVATEAKVGQNVALVLDETVFYAAQGGQVGDSGKIFTNSLMVEINDCQKVAGGNIVHIGVVTEGTIKTGMKVDVLIDEARRHFISCNHSATHLLQSALRRVLGEHVEQAGSSVHSDRLRFDFTHTSPLTPCEIKEVEKIVNRLILDCLPVSTFTVTPEEARKMGALALFGEKYGETVRVVDMEQESIELCGGIHVRQTGSIGVFRILSETGIAAGVRRIEAITNSAAIESFQDDVRLITEVSEIFRTQPSLLKEKAASVNAEIRELKKEVARLKTLASKETEQETVEKILESSEKFQNYQAITAKLENAGIDEMRNLCDKLKVKLESGCIFLAATNSETGAAQFLASATDDAVKKGIHAGNIVKQAAGICGGGGGGKPNHAQAGGKDASKIDEAILFAKNTMKEIFNA